MAAPGWNPGPVAPARPGGFPPARGVLGVRPRKEAALLSPAEEGGTAGRQEEALTSAPPAHPEAQLSAPAAPSCSRNAGCEGDPGQAGVHPAWPPPALPTNFLAAPGMSNSRPHKFQNLSLFCVLEFLFSCLPFSEYPFPHLYLLKGSLSTVISYFVDKLGDLQNAFLYSF